mmetsp:Transcript_85467/g.256023  ORF Transcript_85467/g.256023 Transcript_85467/m.256023 type:complete len:205 (+) Transcript_85467:1087-1701(+)
MSPHTSSPRESPSRLHAAGESSAAVSSPRALGLARAGSRPRCCSSRTPRESEARAACTDDDAASPPTAAVSAACSSRSREPLREKRVAGEGSAQPSKKAPTVAVHETTKRAVRPVPTESISWPSRLANTSARTPALATTPAARAYALVGSERNMIADRLGCAAKPIATVTCESCIRSSEPSDAGLSMMTSVTMRPSTPVSTTRR